MLALIGAATSIAVAWGSVVWSSSRGMPFDANETQWVGIDRFAGEKNQVLFVEYRTFGVVTIEESCGPPPPSCMVDMGGSWEPPPGMCDLPDWARGAQARRGRDRLATNESYEHVRAGWPAHCLEGQRHLGICPPLGTTRPLAEGWAFVPQREVLVLAVEAHPASLDRLVYDTQYGCAWAAPMPLRPLWRGLAINAGAFGAAWGVVLLFPMSARRAWRRRRFACVRCGYSLAGIDGPCPECGHGPRSPRGAAILA
jgi:hypothetical protein